MLSRMKSTIRNMVFDSKHHAGKRQPVPIEKRYPDFDVETFKIIESVKPYTMTSPERIFALTNAVEYIVHHQIEGVFVECGVWKGGSVMAMALTLLRLGVHDRKIALFDTFDGMTEPTGVDTSFREESASELMLMKDADPETSRVWARSSMETVRQAVHPPATI